MRPGELPPSRRRAGELHSSTSVPTPKLLPHGRESTPRCPERAIDARSQLRSPRLPSQASGPPEEFRVCDRVRPNALRDLPLGGQLPFHVSAPRVPLRRDPHETPGE